MSLLGEIRNNAVVINEEKETVDCAYMKTGTVVYRIKKADFNAGKFKEIKPSPGPKMNVRVGRKNVNRDGKTMYILAYRKAMDIDVIFEDGRVVRRTTYYKFRDGKVK